MKLAELAAELNYLDVKLAEVSTEIVGLIKDLRAALDDAVVPDEAVDALNALAAKAAALAVLVPDEPPVE